MSVEVIFFDTETNGLSAWHSVLSIYAIKCVFAAEKDSVNIENTGKYERYYFRKEGEPIGYGAVAVNGLTDEVIAQKRAGVKYPLYFHDDIEAFIDFCGGAKHFCAHNINYDKKYLPFKLINTFCTMKQNTNIIKLYRKNGKLKFPRLSETAQFYEIDFNANELHDAGYDAKLVFEIFKKMLLNKNKKALKFLLKS